LGILCIDDVFLVHGRVSTSPGAVGAIRGGRHTDILMRRTKVDIEVGGITVSSTALRRCADADAWMDGGAAQVLVLVVVKPLGPAAHTETSC
jgi:hypothetical protein